MDNVRTGNDFVIDYLTKLQLKPSKSLQQFWSELSLRYDKSVIATLKRAVERREPGTLNNDIYVLKNQSLKLSLAFARYSADLYRRFFDWWVARPGVAPSRILDIGCDNGIVTCFMGALYPDAQVIGIDIVDNGLRCGRELADTLGLSNVQFQHVDAHTVYQEIPKQTFDCVLSVRSFHELVEDLGTPPLHWGIRELFELEVHPRTASLIETVSTLLRPDQGELITFERLPWMSSTAMWTHRLRQAGLSVDWEASAQITFQEVGQTQQMPVLVCHKSVPEQEPTACIYHFYLRGERAPIVSGAEYEHAEAEAMFHSLHPRTFLTAVEIHFPEEDKMRYELWTYADFVLMYQSTNGGYRKLNVLSPDHRENALHDFRVTIPTHYRGQGYVVIPIDVAADLDMG